MIFAFLWSMNKPMQLCGVVFMKAYRSSSLVARFTGNDLFVTFVFYI